MRNQWKRNAVVATVLLFVCAAVYLNWRYAGNIAENKDTAPASRTGQQKEDGDNGSTKVLGDATLVGGVPTMAAEPGENAESSGGPAASSYFDTARLSKQQSRDNALTLLREAAGQENVEQAAIDDANRAIQTLADQIENLVVAKGYSDCVAFMGENSISVVVSAAEDGLQTEDVAKIKDIVLSETEYTADLIKIMEAE